MCYFLRGNMSPTHLPSLCALGGLKVWEYLSRRSAPMRHHRWRRQSGLLQCRWRLPRVRRLSRRPPRGRTRCLRQTSAGPEEEPRRPHKCKMRAGRKHGPWASPTGSPRQTFLVPAPLARRAKERMGASLRQTTRQRAMRLKGRQRGDASRAAPSPRSPVPWRRLRPSLACSTGKRPVNSPARSNWRRSAVTATPLPPRRTTAALQRRARLLARRLDQRPLPPCACLRPPWVRDAYRSASPSRR